MEKRDGNKRRIAILVFIDQFIKKYGFSPTVREVQEAVGLHSPSVALKHLEILRDLGVISFEPYTARSIRIVGSLEQDFTNFDTFTAEKSNDIYCKLRLPHGTRNVRIIAMVEKNGGTTPIPVSPDNIEYFSLSKNP